MIRKIESNLELEYAPYINFVLFIINGWFFNCKFHGFSWTNAEVVWKSFADLILQNMFGFLCITTQIRTFNELRLKSVTDIDSLNCGTSKI